MCVEFGRVKDLYREREFLVSQYACMRGYINRNNLIIPCDICGIGTNHKGVVLNLHHIDLNRANDAVDNIQPLCERCHKNLHRELPKELKKYGCIICGGNVLRKTKYCKDCRSLLHMVGKECPICKKKYLTRKNKQKKTCSRSCHIANNNKAKTKFTLLELQTLLAEGYTKSEAARFLGVSPSAITKKLKIVEESLNLRDT